MKTRSEADVLKREDTDADRRQSERKARSHTFRININEWRIDEAIERNVLANVVDEFEHTMEDDVVELHRDIDLLVRARTEAHVIETGADKRFIRRQYELKLFELAV